MIDKVNEFIKKLPEMIVFEIYEADEDIWKWVGIYDNQYIVDSAQGFRTIERCKQDIDAFIELIVNKQYKIEYR